MVLWIGLWYEKETSWHFGVGRHLTNLTCADPEIVTTNAYEKNSIDVI